MQNSCNVLAGCDKSCSSDSSGNARSDCLPTIAAVRLSSLGSAHHTCVWSMRQDWAIFLSFTVPKMRNCWVIWHGYVCYYSRLLFLWLLNFCGNTSKSESQILVFITHWWHQRSSWHQRGPASRLLKKAKSVAAEQMKIMPEMRQCNYIQVTLRLYWVLSSGNHQTSYFEL